MTWIDRLTLFAPADALALATIVVAWLFMGWRIENPPAHRPSVVSLMAGYRREWMHQMVRRQPRIFDSQILSSLRAATSFFASSVLIAIGGVLALIGNAERLSGVANQLTLENDPAILWELKLMLVLFFLTNAFLKFVWSNRLFGYCAVLMGAVPNDVSDPGADKAGARAAEINITAARSFNRGLRSVYFSLAAIAWALGPVGLIGATVLTCAVLWRREFVSHSRAVLLEGHDANNTRS